MPVGQGINLITSAGPVICTFLLQDSTGALVTSGSTPLRLYEVQTGDGTLKSYDFDDDTFKATALTTATAGLTHRQGNNNTVDTGVWTYRQATVTGFTTGRVYIAHANNASASPPDQLYKFQFGGSEGDTIDETWDEVVDGTTTARQSMRLHNSAMGGKASGLDTTTAVYRDLADSKDRITATVTADGNRTAVTRDLT